MEEIIVKYWLQIALSLLTTGFIGLAGMVFALFSGVRALLRDRIIWAYNHYMEKNCCPIYALENVNKMYKAYHLLKGNGTVTKLVNELRELSATCEEEKRNED